MTEAPPTVPAPRQKGLAAYWREHPEETRRARRFIEQLTLDTGEKWGKTLAPWQRAAYESSLGLPGAPCGDRHLIEVCGPVGAGKDPIIAACVLAVLHFGPKGLQGLKQSVTRDKSKAVIKTISDFMFRDYVVGEGLVIQRDLVMSAPCDCSTLDFAKDRCEHRNSVVTCGSLDGASTAGVIYDICWLNEVQEWPEPDGKEVYFHILGRRSKRKGRICCFTNAPYTPKGEWRRDRWETARKESSPDWWYQQAKIEDCPWITPEDLEEARRNLPSVRFRRWYFCEPSDGRGELVSREEVDRVEDMSKHLGPAPSPLRPGRRFLGLDVGISRDHYAMSLICDAADGLVYLERMESFVPPPSGQIDLAATKTLALHYAKTWGAKILCDPYQAAQLIQELQAAGCEVETIDPTAKNTTEMAHAVMSLYRDGRFRTYPNAGFVQVTPEFSTTLAQQLLDAEIKEGERGVRIVQRRTKAGHGDQATAFALAALGVARAGVYSSPVTCGSSLDMDTARADLARRRLTGFSRPHEGRFLGARASGLRRVAR